MIAIERILAHKSGDGKQNQPLPEHPEATLFPAHIRTDGVSQTCMEHSYHNEVAPLTGAWIEIPVAPTGAKGITVAPLAGGVD